jgi:predicted DNA-binding transcriptional regulator AlpA
MSIRIRKTSKAAVAAGVVRRSTRAAGIKRRSRPGQCKTLPIPASLDGLARLRLGHVMALLQISQSTAYCRLRAGKIPPPDGRDGRRPYWRTETLRQFLSDTGAGRG